jgi:NADP-dependent 3-hydroxy acid dehydrogenase YdfG
MAGRLVAVLRGAAALVVEFFLMLEASACVGEEGLPADGRGELVGDGDGRVEGPRRAGTRFMHPIHWAEATPGPTLSGMSTTNKAGMDKVVVITGASGGIGAELAKQLGARGAKVVLAARRKEELDAVAAEIGENALAAVTDVTKRGDVEHLAKAALERFGRIDVWVNNAGRGISRSVSDLGDDDLDAMWRDNMKSVVYGIQAVLPHFKQRNAGQIVNVSSGLSRAPLAPVRAAYGAVKSAVNMLTASLRVELRATHPGIHVTLLLPGVVATEFGLNSLGVGIVDNRKLPGAQPVEGAAGAIVDVIENPRSEAYTSSFIADVIARYRREPDAFEAEIASRQQR